MKFTKMHGLGNDYVYVDRSREELPADLPDLARRVSDRHTGIGSDGLILIGPSEKADVRMEMYNADGSRAQMCGNGIRCVAKYAIDHGLGAGPELRIETDSGFKRRCSDRQGRMMLVTISMGKPTFAPETIPVALEGDRIVEHPIRLGDLDFTMTCISMGNPHAVVFVDRLSGLPFHRLGPMLEAAEMFPERINAHFVELESPARLIVKTWERGSGPTRACGTGACAVAVAGAVTGRSHRKVTTSLPGGELEIEWADDDEVYMTGPAEEVFHGEWAG